MSTQVLTRPCCQCTSANWQIDPNCMWSGTCLQIKLTTEPLFFIVHLPNSSLHFSKSVKLHGSECCECVVSPQSWGQPAMTQRDEREERCYNPWRASSRIVRCLSPGSGGSSAANTNPVHSQGLKMHPTSITAFISNNTEFVSQLSDSAPSWKRKVCVECVTK